MAIAPLSDKIGTTQETGFSTNWDWKGEYVSKLQDDGYERFSQYSATPDTTALFAGPARFTGLAGNTANLIPIGLVDGIQFSSNAALTRLYEIGSNRAFFTRGKTQSNISFSKMLADQSNILRALTANAYDMAGLINTTGAKAPGALNASGAMNTMMNLDSELFSIPFGLMLVFKTRGGDANGTGKILSSLYLEYCMFDNYNFSIQSTAPAIMEGIQIQFDRPVPVQTG